MVLRPQVVAKSIAELCAIQINPTFVGYLALKRIAARDGRTDSLRFDYKEFYKTFLATPGGPPGRPNFRPFWHQRATPRSSPVRFWTHDNPAGTFSAASIARVQRFLYVVAVEGEGEDARYSLRPQHWNLARQHLVYGTKVPVLPLAAWLYRDFAFDSALNDARNTLIRVFRDEFGYPEGSEEEFTHLFDDDPSAQPAEDWLQEFL